MMNSRAQSSASVSPVAPGTLYLVNDDRSRREVSITMWSDSNSAYGSIALGRLTPGDTLVLLGIRRSSDSDSRIWDILSKGKVAYIYVDSDTMINFRRVSFLDE